MFSVLLICNIHQPVLSGRASPPNRCWSKRKLHNQESTLDPPLWQGTLMQYKKVPWQHLPVKIKGHLLWIVHTVNCGIKSCVCLLDLHRWLYHSTLANSVFSGKCVACQDTTLSSRCVFRTMLNGEVKSS